MSGVDVWIARGADGGELTMRLEGPTEHWVGRMDSIGRLPADFPIAVARGECKRFRLVEVDHGGD